MSTDHAGNWVFTAEHFGVLPFTDTVLHSMTRYGRLTAQCARCVCVLLWGRVCAGPYRHYCMYTKAFDAILKCKPSTWQGTNASWKLQLDVRACCQTAVVAVPLLS